jgi:hypothetical protein
LNETPRRFHPYIYLFLAFLAGCLLTGLFFNRHRFADIGRLDQKYASQHARAAATIGRLETELDRERRLNRELHEHNTRVRVLAGELTGTVERNVRNLQDAVAIIGEIRAKLKVLAEFYSDSDSGDGDN